VWDFKLSPGIEPIRDSSAGAIAVCGLKELARHDSSEGRFSETANRLLSRLCTEDYLNFDAGCPGVLRNAQVGDGPARAQNVYASWGDYFLMEALGRELFQAEVWW
jgi:unsaturated chondroitin disaccharide hydrolase